MPYPEKEIPKCIKCWGHEKSDKPYQIKGNILLITLKPNGDIETKIFYDLCQEHLDKLTAWLMNRLKKDSKIIPSIGYDNRMNERLSGF